MRTRPVVAVCLFAVLSLLPQVGHAVPPFEGTIFVDPDIITASDATTFIGIGYAGTGPRVMFDRRTNA